MMENAKISVIMPVYGVEAYVGKAIESIQKQTYKNWEFFCVDDGTKDRSGEICDEYAAKDPRIKVIHKENGAKRKKCRNRSSYRQVFVFYGFRRLGGVDHAGRYGDGSREEQFPVCCNGLLY